MSHSYPHMEERDPPPKRDSHNDHVQDDYVQTDNDVGRDRTSRAVAAFVLPIFVVWFTYLLGTQFALSFKLPVLLGQMFGAGFGAPAALWIISRSYVNNDAFVAFITVDPLAAIFGFDPYVLYGPGFHFCFPWEQRSAVSVVRLAEVTEVFEFKMQGKGGKFFINGSIRLRPDIRLLTHYLAGAGAVVGNITDLIIVQIAQELHDKEVRAGIGLMSKINIFLTQFKRGEHQSDEITEFESRFGVIIGDVTVATIDVSEEVEKALDGIAEDAALELITARNLGFKTAAGMYKAIKANERTPEQVTTARKMAMVVTNNLHGMNVSEQNFNLHITGDPAVVQAVGAIGPAIAAHFGKKEGAGKPKTSSKGETK